MIHLIDTKKKLKVCILTFIYIKILKKLKKNIEVKVEKNQKMKVIIVTRLFITFHGCHGSNLIIILIKMIVFDILNLFFFKFISRGILYGNYYYRDVSIIEYNGDYNVLFSIKFETKY
jgi:hypothetical protein